MFTIDVIVTVKSDTNTSDMAARRRGGSGLDPPSDVRLGLVFQESPNVRFPLGASGPGIRQSGSDRVQDPPQGAQLPHNRAQLPRWWWWSATFTASTMISSFFSKTLAFPPKIASSSSMAIMSTEALGDSRPFFSCWPGRYIYIYISIYINRKICKILTFG